MPASPPTPNGTARTALVTGATSGVGLALCERLAKEGWRVLVHGRDPQKLDRAVRWVRRRAPQAQAETVEADLADLDAVRWLAGDVAGRTGRLDVLVHNAGLMRPGFEMAPSGVEQAMAVNALAPFALTEALRPLLLATAAAHSEARVVSVSSEAHGGDLGTPDPEALVQRLRKPTPPDAYDAVQVYALAKRVMTTWTMELARRLDGTGATANACHPGLVRTGVFHGVGGGKGLVAIALSPLFLPPDAGARSAYWLATAPEWRGQTGRWVTRSHRRGPHEAAPPVETSDPAWGAAVWEALARLAAPAG